ncbi:MAG: radical SAM/SPASM domain-containing protein [Geobacteraceae bacterium]
MPSNVCAHPWQQISINIDGAVFPCCFWSSYQNTGAPLGNVNEQTIGEIWNGPGYRNLRRSLAAGETAGLPCQACMALQTSGGKYPVHLDPQGLEADCLSGRNAQMNRNEYEAGAEEMLSMPISLTYVGTVACNIRCSFCNQYPQHLDGMRQRRETVEEVRRLIPKLIVLAWQGGETFFDPAFQKFFHTMLREENPNLHLAFPTNGMLANVDVLERLKKEFKGFTAMFSIDSFKRETYATLRHGADFDTVMEHLDIFQNNRERPDQQVGVQCCVMKSNILELTDILRKAAEKSLYFNLSPVVEWPPHEMINCFTDFSSQTDGWREELERARHFLKEQDEKSMSRETAFSPLGTIETISGMLENMRKRYINTHKIRVLVNDVSVTVTEGGVMLPFFIPHTDIGYSTLLDLMYAVDLDYILYEDDRPLGPRISDHKQVLSMGRGRYSIWPSLFNGHDVFMSSSDNSDPRVNGRHYLLRPVLLGDRDRLNKPRKPVLVAALGDALTVPVGYVLLENSLEYTMEIPGDIPMEKLEFYYLNDTLDTRERPRVYAESDGKGGLLLGLTRVRELMFV